MPRKKMSDYEKNFRKSIEDFQLPMNLPKKIKEEDKEDLEFIREQLLIMRLPRELRVGICDEEMDGSCFDFAAQG